MPCESLYQCAYNQRLASTGVTFQQKDLPPRRITHERGQAVHGYNLFMGRFKRENIDQFLI